MSVRNDESLYLADYSGIAPSAKKDRADSGRMRKAGDAIRPLQ